MNNKKKFLSKEEFQEKLVNFMVDECEAKRYDVRESIKKYSNELANKLGLTVMVELKEEGNTMSIMFSNGYNFKITNLNGFKKIREERS